MTFEKTVLQMIEEHAAKTPDAISIICGKRILTYKELQEKTNKLARYLIRHGVHRESVVPVLLESSLELVVAMIGIMKAGGAYVPIDAGYPSDRIAYILHDTTCKVIVTDRSVGMKLPHSENFHPVFIDEHWPSIECELQMLPSNLPSSCDLAYIIYTSGSTGKPKGVMVEHSQLCTYLLDVCDRFELQACRSYAVLGTFSADAGLTAVFAALCFGKSLSLIDVKSFTNFSGLALHFKEFPVDCYKTTPSLMEFFLQHQEVHAVLPKKKLILGGEASTCSLIERLFEILPEDCTLYNHYGPTETTIGVVTYEFDRTQNIPTSVPLGKPLRHVTAYILDENFSEVQPGAEGELCIAGPLVTRGYLNNPQMTANKFVFYKRSSAVERIYRTGDLVKRAANGDILYLGRMDDQVKINGNRIELNEIQFVILKNSMVHQCVVITKKNKIGVQHLVAYIIPREKFSKELLLSSMKRELPGYMIPTKWVVLDRWPLTFNNKIDRNALPDPFLHDASEVRRDEHPATDEMKMQVAELWEQVLGIQQIGDHEDFFELGGDSMLLIKLGFMINSKFKRDISYAMLFGHLTIHKMAGLLSGNESKPIVIDHGHTGDEFDEAEASIAQKNLFIQNKLNAGEPFLNSSLTFEIKEKLDMCRLEHAFTEVIKAHESLRSTYFFSKGKLFKHISENVEFRIEFRKTESADIDREIINVTRWFDFVKGPLIRVFVLTLPDDRMYLHIDLPHINSDGESMKIIVEDVIGVYNDTNVVKKILQFSDFQKSVYNYIRSPQFEDDEQFWKEQLSGMRPSAIFNLNKPSGAFSKFDGVFVVTKFPKDLDEKMKGYLSGQRITRFQLLLIAYFLLLHKITAARNMTVMVPVHNRNAGDFANVVGLLANVVLINVHVKEDESINDFLTDCRSKILSAIRHQRYPFELLMKQWAAGGYNSKGLAHSFFGYHLNPGFYRIGNASLNLYVAAKHKENLPLSMAIFETEVDIIARISSTAGVFAEKHLNDFLHQYFNILENIIMSNRLDSVRTLLQDQVQINL